MTAEQVPRPRVPHPALRELVTTYHGYHHVGLTPGEHRGLPAAELTVVIALDEPLDVAWHGDERSRGRHWAMVSGLHAAPAVIRYERLQHGIQLGLTPAGARSLLGLPAAQLVRTLLPLRDLFGPGAEQMYDEVAGASTWADRYEALDRHLCARARDLSDVAPVRGELRFAWDALQRADGVHVEAVADELGWSRRHLSAEFGREFGLSPKQLVRVARFQRARSLMPAANLSRVSAEAGFADQAHLTREWRELSGYTPTEWLRAEFPFLQDAVASQ